MASVPKSDMKHDRCTCTVELSSDEVDAGAEITLKARVAGLRMGGLSRPGVSVRDQEDAELAHANLQKTDGETYQSHDIVLTAPRIVGVHTYRAVVVTTDKDGTGHEQASTDVRFTVKPHTVDLNIWDVPPAIVAGERFRFMVGTKCSAGCNLSGQGLRIVGGGDSEIASAKLGADIWPGTEALYFAEVDAQAPPTAGDHQWQVKTAAWDCELPHAAGASAMAVKVVSPPDHEVTIEAIDRETQTPIKGARVVMHPYRATTDENGIATIKVTNGRYDILVSGSKYVPVSIAMDVTSDTRTRAELDVEPPWEPADEA